MKRIEPTSERFCTCNHLCEKRIGKYWPDLCSGPLSWSKFSLNILSLDRTNVSLTLPHLWACREFLFCSLILNNAGPNLLAHPSQGRHTYFCRQFPERMSGAKGKDVYNSDRCCHMTLQKGRFSLTPVCSKPDSAKIRSRQRQNVLILWEAVRKIRKSF